ncbi:YqiA/YcfP family alpha/beta fold hydrolase [Imhoffiella purpurea]|uniref:Putative esterase n=1 Tax=Imhoffiella purpurea TaxID=1249627 RepID=W9VCT6_9GAMM|nr:YqiA/YcfP family alpha/beta fold hydrolase [Imhoffiella purpurea]EXJ13827.1 Putative esterase [Imhoffiella purpurea]
MLIYLHGLDSSSQSAKAKLLRERLAPFEVRAIDYRPHRPDEAVARLSRFFADLGDCRPAVIGSSMGGFYGQYLARRFDFSHLFMINPALTPWIFVEERIGSVQTAADGEEYPITAELVERLRAYGIAQPCDGTPTTLFLDRGDTLLDYRIAEDLYRDCARLMIWDGGDHAFQHMEEAIEIVREHLAQPEHRR